MVDTDGDPDETDEELEVFVTGRRGNTSIARIGDSTLKVPDAPPKIFDLLVAVSVTDFGPDSHEGTAEFIRKVGESAF